MSSTADALAAPAQVLGAASELAWRSVSSRDVSGRVGFDFDGPLEADSTRIPTGVRRVRMPELGRIELRFGAAPRPGICVRTARCGRCRREVSSIRRRGSSRGRRDRATSARYDLVFLQDDGASAGRGDDRAEAERKRRADARLGGRAGHGRRRSPAASSSPGGRSTPPRGRARASARCTCGRSAATCRRLARCSWGRRSSAARARMSAAVFGPQFSHAGWGLTASGLAPGTYDVTAYFWSTRTDRFEDARTVTVTVR